MEWVRYTEDRHIMILQAAAAWLLAVSWIGFSVMLAWNHFRVRRARRLQGIAEEKPALRDPRSMGGLALEGLSFFVAVVFDRAPPEAPVWQAGASILFGLLALLLLALALRHLGLQWRIKAIVTEDHRLITTGPYAVLRHPIFASLLCLLLATVNLITEPWAAVAAIAICVYGTEIRVRAEDGLLQKRFGERFEAYRRRVPAYVPFLR